MFDSYADDCASFMEQPLKALNMNDCIFCQKQNCTCDEETMQMMDNEQRMEEQQNV